MTIANDFGDRWNFHNCIGAMLWTANILKSIHHYTQDLCITIIKVTFLLYYWVLWMHNSDSYIPLSLE